jgi:hypothetical protein
LIRGKIHDRVSAAEISRGGVIRACSFLRRVERAEVARHTIDENAGSPSAAVGVHSSKAGRAALSEPTFSTPGLLGAADLVVGHPGPRAEDREVRRLVPLAAVDALTPAGVTAFVESSLPHVEESVVRLVPTDDEIPRPVVGPIPVHVVDMCAVREQPAERALSYEHVLVGITDADISVRVFSHMENSSVVH